VQRWHLDLNLGGWAFFIKIKKNKEVNKLGGPWFWPLGEKRKEINCLRICFWDPTGQKLHPSTVHGKKSNEMKSV
jgi:hypothetical protein